ncbi:hypothetical protein MTO96_038679, partial [Rhipicephalus appendiculatus]
MERYVLAMENYTSPHSYADAEREPGLQPCAFVEGFRSRRTYDAVFKLFERALSSFGL